MFYRFLQGILNLEGERTTEAIMTNNLQQIEADTNDWRV